MAGSNAAAAPRYKRPHPFFSQKAILFPVLALVGIGLVMVYSASSAISVEDYNTLFHYFQRQAVFLGIGLCVMAVASSFPYQLYKSLAYIILILALALLVAVLIPALQVKAGGAARWLNLGGFTFQPAEFTKLALILFMAYSLSKKHERIKQFSVGFVPHLMIIVLFGLLIALQRDFGTIVVIGFICWGMMFVAGVKIFHLIAPLPFILPLVYFMVIKVPYRLQRITTFLNPWDDPYNTGYQITNSLKAFGSGGLAGKGIGLGMQKMHYLPEPHTDFIFSVIGEELGLIGVLAILSLYTVILYTGTRIARQADTLFGAMIAVGITLYIGIQVFINTGVALGLLPTKGLTLPFISYGGTSLIISMAAMGILMNIGAQAYNE